MDEYSRITLTRDCVDLDKSPHIKCTKQEIVVKGISGKVDGKFPINELAKLPDGSFKYNLTRVIMVEMDEGGGDSSRFFYFRFAPQDSKDVEVMPNGQQFPKYQEVVTDMFLRPLKGMRLSSKGSAAKWLSAIRRESDKKVKSGEIDNPLLVVDYLVVMADR